MTWLISLIGVTAVVTVGYSIRSAIIKTNEPPLASETYVDDGIIWNRKDDLEYYLRTVELANKNIHNEALYHCLMDQADRIKARMDRHPR